MGKRQFIKRIVLIFTIGVAIFLCCRIKYKSNSEKYKAPFVINEVCINNFSGLYDHASSGYADWIEIYNTSDIEESLEGFTITKSKKTDNAFTFGDLTLGAHSYILVYCNGLGNDVTCAPFKLSSNGEEIVLSSPDGQPVDSVSVPSMGYDECYARIEDGGMEWQIMTATPYQSNVQGTPIPQASIQAPILSLKDGFYDEGVELSITVPEGTTVFYSTDGSVPTIYSNKYTGPLQLNNVSKQPNVYTTYTNINQDYSYEKPSELVDKANVIRAIAITDDGQFSEVATGVYFVGFREDDEVRNSCIVSLVTDPINLFDDNSGIYVTGTSYDNWYFNGQNGEAPKRNYEASGSPSEREAVFTFFDEKGNCKLSQEVGIRIQGNSTRNQTKKRFSIFAREGYSGSDYFDIDITDSGRKVHSFTLFNDVNNLFISDVLADRTVGSQTGRPCFVFLDGEYWDSYYLMEKISGDFIEQKYNVPKDNVVLIKNNSVACGTSDDIQYYEELNDYLLNTDFSQNGTYEELCQMIDIQSFCDHFASCLYLANMNWRPINNHVLWRSREEGDGAYEDKKWRWVMNDFDMYYDDYTIDSFNYELHFGGTYMNSAYLPNLLKNEQFKEQFVKTYYDLANTYLEPQQTIPILQSLTNDGMLESFLNNRFAYASENIVGALDLQGTADITISSTVREKEVLKLNTVMPDMSDGSIKVTYPTDYTITLQAMPIKGYQFKGWRINGDSRLIEQKKIVVSLQKKDNQIEAVYQSN